VSPLLGKPRAPAEAFFFAALQSFMRVTADAPRTFSRRSRCIRSTQFGNNAKEMNFS
jgi:hypothetical protein